MLNMLAAVYMPVLCTSLVRIFLEVLDPFCKKWMLN